ncbi:Glycosyltransferase [Wenxinia marina DSM 24838]|uniref:Glycosyltransferase n=2 Tax=Wenxinia TaxID=653686 RepID=A0A0D0QIW1_9RHOB|nr:Glycosyltransferase [Wenxinia marina DSM 24838]
MRRLAVARPSRAGLGRRLAALMSPGTAFFQTGLMNVTPRTLAAFRRVPEAKVAVLVHDTIPLDLPDYARPGAGARLQALLDVAAKADLILCPSSAAAGSIRRHLPSAVPVRPAPLGLTPARADPSALPAGPDLAAPYFVAVGTIEARKDIGLLLDVWEALPEPRPHLYLCGARGWRVEAETARLDAGVPGVTELPGLTDGAVAALLQGARALLFPSRAEGFGLPPFEALAQGTLPVCADLAIWQEHLGDRAVYLAPGDRDLWRRTVEQLATAPKRDVPVGALPDWDTHFSLALTAGW